MATLKFRDENGAWQYAPSLKYKDINGVFQNNGALKYKDTNGTWHKVKIVSKSGSSDDGDYPTIGSLTVGSTVYLNENGTLVDYIIVQRGLPNSPLYDASCDGVWLLRKDVYNINKWDSTNNDYANSDIHTYLNGTLLNLFDSSTRSTIKQVKLPYQKGTGSNGSISSASDGLSTKVFLLSGYEVGLTVSDNDYLPIDGVCLTYFNGVTNSQRIAKYNGTATDWWLRSAHTYDTAGIWYIDNTGEYYGGDYTVSYGVRPALVMPFDTEVMPNNDGWEVYYG